ncbi:MAG TPA: hypothetical protein VKT99_17215 [Xanthobacteraceae bacterium]|nr:hypothetical protein [Xanthobacteraceae bacterium]
MDQRMTRRCSDKIISCRLDLIDVARARINASSNQYAFLIKLRRAHPRIPMGLPANACLEMFMQGRGWRSTSRCSRLLQGIRTTWSRGEPTMRATLQKEQERALRRTAIPAARKTASLPFADNALRAGTATGRSGCAASRSPSRSCALDLSRWRANAAALDILGAYKLTGNFHVNLEIVLKNIGVLGKVRYRIEPNPKLSYSTDRRHVVFEPNEDVPNDAFCEIMKSIEARLGCETPWWIKLFRRLIAEQRSANQHVALPSSRWRR